MATSVEELTICAICTEVFTDPQALSCDHVFCKRCVNKLVKNGIIKCPNCSIFCPVDDVKPDFRLATFLDASDETVEFKTKPIRSSANIDDVTQQHVTPPPAKPKYKC